MSKKRLTKEEQIQDVQERLKEARAKRLQAYYDKMGEIPKETPKDDYKEEFKSFWIKNRSLYGKDKDFGDIVWLHLKSAGFCTPDKFEAGIEHFGLSKAKQSLR